MNSQIIGATDSSAASIHAPFLKQETLSNRVIEWVKQCIIDGTFRLGTELPSEQEMCTLLGVGKSSVREAMKMLQMIGVVEIQQGKRSRIHENLHPDVMSQLIFNLLLANATPKELFDFRVMFETAVSHFAMSCATEEGIAALEHEVERYHQLCQTGEAKPEDEFVFHQMLYDVCNNTYISRIGALLLSLFTAPMQRSPNYDTFHDTVEHRQIVQALKTKDPVLLDEALKHSFCIYEKTVF